jgi:hypothetical protein
MKNLKKTKKCEEIFDYLYALKKLKEEGLVEEDFYNSKKRAKIRDIIEDKNLGDIEGLRFLENLTKHLRRHFNKEEFKKNEAIIY